MLMHTDARRRLVVNVGLGETALCGEGFGKPDMVAYSGAISASAMGARWEDALALCADMTQKRLSADVTWKELELEFNGVYSTPRFFF